MDMMGMFETGMGEMIQGFATNLVSQLVTWIGNFLGGLLGNL